MPNRWFAIGISAFWAIMMGLLVERDVLPHLRTQQRPDFRSIAQTVVNPGPVRWAIMEGEDRIGRAETEWLRQPDEWAEFRSSMELSEMPLLSLLGPSGRGGTMRWQSSFHVAPDGNLRHFDMNVFLADSKPTMTVQGKLGDNDLMRVVFRSGSFVHEEQFYYEPRSLMTAALAPIDRLPNLAVGKTWQYRVMNPLTRTSDTVRCRVTGEQVITWRGDPVLAYLVEQNYGQIRGRCWVSHDGTVLRQEVPLGWKTVVLEHE